jgi:hypothetical protein
MIRNILVVLVSLAVLSFGLNSCRSGGSKDGFQDIEIDESELDVATLQVSEEAMTDIVENISSPVEMAALIKSLGVDFSKDYLAPTANVDKLNTSFKQALNLGIYGADLGYLNMYNKTSTVLDYISVIKDLSDDIKVGQFFDFSTLKRLATNNSNLDSLMDISVRSFNLMDSYLRSNNRGNLSTLIITGVWIEGLYLATQVASKSPHPDLRERIGEQKITLEKLMLLLKNYEKDKNFQELISQFESLSEIYKGITITIEAGETEAIERDGMLVFVQNEKSIVNITDEQLNHIITKTDEVRKNLLQL